MLVASPPSAGGGNVVGPASSAGNAIVVFDGTTGKLIKDGGGIAANNGALRTTGVGLGAVVGNTRGEGSVDLQTNRTLATQVAAGTYGFVAGQNNRAWSYATAIGRNNAAEDTYSIALGNSNTASNSGSVAIGESNTCSGIGATCLGNSCAASGTLSVATGNQAKAYLRSQNTFAGGMFAAAGDAQTSILVMRRVTTDATPIELFIDGVGNRLILANDTTWAFEILLVTRRADVDNTSATFTFVGAIDRNATAATTALVGVPTKTVVSRDDAAYEADVTADTTNGSLRITVTGVAAHTVRWVARVTLSEVSG